MESFRLETIGELHPIATQLFVPFAVSRLQRHLEDTDAVLAIELRGIHLEALHREKAQQLLANPYGSDSYVVVVGFATRRVIFSFHSNDGGSA